MAYVDLYALSRGHEVCSDEPWVNGRETDQARALAFHPFAEAARYGRGEVLRVLAPGPTPGTDARIAARPAASGWAASAVSPDGTRASPGGSPSGNSMARPA